MKGEQQTKYPMGPLSLAQLAYFKCSLAAKRGADAYDVGIVAVAELGVYPTFGHVDCRHRRWYKPLYGPRTPDTAIAIPAE